MADSAGEKTEMPTPKKLRDARQKGQVCSSKDITSTAILVVLFVLLAWMGVALMEDMEALLRFLSGSIAANNAESVGEASKMTALLVCKHSFIFVFVAALIGVAGNVAQIGFLFTIEPIIPKMECEKSRSAGNMKEKRLRGRRKKNGAVPAIEIGRAHV